MNINVRAGERKDIVIIHKSPDTEKRTIRLQGKGAEVHVEEIFLNGAKSTVEIIHEAPNTISRLNSRGVVDKGQEAQANANIVIPKHAQNCDSFVSQNFMLLDENAHAQAIPSLEIEADEVKAGHAATVAPLNLEKLFYMTSRGISEENARKLIIEGFLNIPE